MADPLEPGIVAFLAAMRIGHLATVAPDGAPLVLPVCFAVHERQLYIALDEKPKTRDALDLERVRNLQAHPHVAVVVDHWDEDWTRLAWVHLSGPARIVLPNGPEATAHGNALALLRGKYVQYRAMRLEERPLIAMEIERIQRWGNFDRVAAGAPHA